MATDAIETDEGRPEAAQEKGQPDTTVNQTPSSLNLEGVYRTFRAKSYSGLDVEPRGTLDDAPSLAQPRVGAIAHYANQ